VVRGHGRAIIAMAFQTVMQRVEAMAIVDMRFEAHNANIKVASNNVISAAIRISSASNAKDMEAALEDMREQMIRISTSLNYLKSRI
jgi:hypothetical protein